MSMKKIIVVLLVLIFPLQGADFISQIKKIEAAGTPVIHASTIPAENRTEEIVSRVNSELSKSCIVVLADKKGKNSMVDALLNHAKSNPEKGYLLFESPVLASNDILENRIQAKTYLKGSANFTNLSREFKKITDVSSDKRDGVKTKIVDKVKAMVAAGIKNFPNKELGDNFQVILNITRNDDSSLTMNAMIADALIATGIKKLIINYICQDSQEDESDTSESSDDSGCEIEEVDEHKGVDTIKDESPKKEHWIKQFVSAHSGKIIGGFSIAALIGYILYLSIHKN